MFENLRDATRRVLNALVGGRPPSSQFDLETAETAAEVPDPTTASIRGGGRERIIEGSTTPTYLQPSKPLGQLALRLSVLDVKITYGQHGEHDLVQELHDATTGRGQWPNLTQVQQYLAAKTLKEVSGMDDSKLENHEFLLGQIDPALLHGIEDEAEFMQILTHGYPEHVDLADELASTAIVGRDFSGQVISPESDAGMLIGERFGSIGGEADFQSRIDILRFTLDTLDAYGHEISFDRMQLLNPFAPALANCAEDVRRSIVDQMVNNSYPFHQDNRNSWPSEIATRMN